MSSKNLKARVFTEAAIVIANHEPHPYILGNFENKARRLGRPPACCNALVHATGSFKYDEPHNVFFQLLFKPGEYEFNNNANQSLIDNSNSWLASFWWGDTKEPENQMARTLALLFAAEMVKDTRRRKYETDTNQNQEG
jgi:hypothetical protein